MGSATKGKILDAALESFAENGYKGTNLRDLASGMGLSKSALYKHYTSKEDIWNAVVDRMEAYYDECFGAPGNFRDIPNNSDELKKLTMKMLEFTVYDERIVMIRKLLLTEQFRDERIRCIATEHFNERLEALFTEIFRRMMENGVLSENDPSILAFSYTAPISTLVLLCDREPEKKKAVMEKTERFIEHFVNIYGKEDDND